MESEISHFQYFVSVFWPFFMGALAVRVLCWFYGQVVWWLAKSMGD